MTRCDSCPLYGCDAFRRTDCNLRPAQVLAHIESAGHAAVEVTRLNDTNPRYVAGPHLQTG